MNKERNKSKVIKQTRRIKKIDVLYSSHYVRAISTAKYIADKNSGKK